jgi:Carbohydrate-selective porin, OprB family/S-layer homology domain
MLKSGLNILLLSSLTVGAALGCAIEVGANENLPPLSISDQLQQIAQQDAQQDDSVTPMSQVTSVSQLTDVRPIDWAFQALQSLVERYGCIVGYPDRTYRGNRALTRYEFASGLNACLDKVQELLGAATADLVKKEDLAILQRLQEEFAAELATLRGRVDRLEAQTATLEKQQFSTTTKLSGEAAFAVSSVFGGDKADGSGERLQDNPVFDYRVRLALNTSFTGKDLLQTRLDALNVTPFGPGEGNFPNVTGTSMTRFSFDEGSGGAVRVGKMFYRFGLGALGEIKGEERLTFVIDAVGGEFDVNFGAFNEYFEEEFNGAISRFGRFNPIYYQGLEGTGASAQYRFSDAIVLSVGYLAAGANDPNPKNGLFNGAFAALAQLSFQPTETLSVGLTYARSYFPGDSVVVSGETGSAFANEPFGEVATAADNFGVQAFFQISPKIALSGWAGLTLAQAKSSSAEVQRGDDASIFNWAVTLALPDFGRKGSVLGFIAGQPPKVTRNDVRNREDGTTAWHFETLYRYQITDNISISPGVLVILNPEHNRSNDPIWVGTIRTNFQF